MTNFSVRADFFACAHMTRSYEATRYYLNGVFLDPESPRNLNRPGVFIVATDGHRMTVFHDENGSADAPVIVAPDKDLIKYALPGKRKHETGDPCVKLVNENGHARLQRYGAPNGGRHDEAPRAVNLSIVDGTFPDWRRIILEDRAAATVLCFNGEYLGDFGDMARRLTGSPAFSIMAADPASPALLRMASCPEFLGILMGVRGGASGLPDWIKRDYSAETARAAE